MPSTQSYDFSTSGYRPWPFRAAALVTSKLQATRPKPPPLDDDTELEEGLALPVEPDEGTPLIPDDERVIKVPS